MSEVRPTTLDDIIGQERAKRQLRIAINSAKSRNAVLGHILLDAPPGTGKTTLARAAANEMGTKIRLFNGAGINKFTQLYGTLDAQAEGDILFIDEIHALPKKVCESLYTAMEDFRYDYQPFGSTDIQPFCLMAASTDMGKLPKPLRDRFANYIQLGQYTLEDMTEIVRRVAKIHKLSLGDKEVVRLAKTCRFTPRLAVHRVSTLRDFFISECPNKVAQGADADKIISEVFDLSGIDNMGLTKNDHRYLEALNGIHAMSIDSLASKLNITKTNILNEIEPYLINLGLVRVERPYGRVINRDKYKELLKNLK